MKEKPGLLHSDYNLGRAEMLLGNDAAALRHLERATTAAGSDPEVVEQSWYQLGIVYRRLHRMEEARSEEHTSELQSQPNFVCRLLLAKKTNSSQRTAALTFTGLKMPTSESFRSPTLSSTRTSSTVPPATRLRLLQSSLMEARTWLLIP